MNFMKDYAVKMSNKSVSSNLLAVLYPGTGETSGTFGTLLASKTALK
jgi:hypothetical protein